MWAWLMACAEPGRGVQDAEPVACLGLPDGVELPADGVVTGLAAADSADLDVEFSFGERCADVGRVLQLEGDAGTWSLGYGWIEDGLDATLPMPVGPGEALTVSYAVRELASGFVVRRGDRVLAALEVGTGGASLPADAIAGLALGTGDVVGSEALPCGRVTSREIVFRASEEVALQPVSTERVLVDGQPLAAWALANTSFSGAGCEDEARFAWALWRDQ